MRPLIAVAVAAVLSLALTARAQQTEKAEAAEPNDRMYEIKLSRPTKVGDKFRIDASGVIQSTTILAIDGKEQKPPVRRHGISIDGIVKVLEVAKGGGETKLAITIHNCAVEVLDQKLPMLPRGTVIVATWDKAKRGTSFTLDGKELPQDASELLDLIISTSDPESISDDEIFGSKEKRRVEDTWSINAEAAAKELARLGLHAKLENLSGSTKLVKEERAQDLDCLLIKTTFKADSITSDSKGDERLKLESATLEINTEVVLPVDVARQATSAKMNMTLTRNLVGKDEAGRAVKATEVIERLSERPIFQPATKPAD